MTMDLVTTEDIVSKIKEESKKNHFFLSDEAALVHPTILHNFRFKINKRVGELEPVPGNHSWKLDYLIDEMGNIRIIIKS